MSTYAIHGLAPTAHTVYDLAATYVCKTGAAAIVQCGSIFLSMLIVTAGGATITGLVGSQMLACAGDSGGPVTAGHLAYGLVVASTDDLGNCGLSTFWKPIGPAISKLNVQLLLS